MKHLMGKMGLKTVNVIEKSTLTEKEIPGSPEIKGVRGTDKRQYLLDLVKLNPRDGNY